MIKTAGYKERGEEASGVVNLLQVLPDGDLVVALDSLFHRWKQQFDGIEVEGIDGGEETLRLRTGGRERSMNRHRR